MFWVIVWINATFKNKASDYVCSRGFIVLILVFGTVSDSMVLSYWEEKREEASIWTGYD